MNLAIKIKNFMSTKPESIYEAAAFSALIGFVALLSYCPRCGEWQGPGSEGKGPAAPKSDPPPPPRRLIKALSNPLPSAANTGASNVSHHKGKLTKNSGILESPGRRDDMPAKSRYQPPNAGHGRVVETLYGGSPKPDDRPHGHSVDFLRGDGANIPIYDRSIDDTVVYESDVDVVYQQESGSYVWTPKGS